MGFDIIYEIEKRHINTNNFIYYTIDLGRNQAQITVINPKINTMKERKEIIDVFKDYMKWYEHDVIFGIEIAETGIEIENGKALITYTRDIIWKKK